MQHQFDTQISGSDSGGRISFLISTAATLAVFAYSLFIFPKPGTITDTSWLLTVLDRMSTGDRLYVDVIETNPPFSIWLYMPPYFLAKMLGVTPDLAAHVYTFLICVLGVLVACRLLIAAGLADGRRMGTIFPLLLAFAVIFSGNSFTERDQIGALLALPLFVLSFWRSDETIEPRPELRHWLVAGILGGVLPLAKPYYAIVYLVSASWVAYRRRDIRMLFLPEYLLPAAMLLIYIAAAYFIYPQFFHTILPLLNETYLAYRQPFWALLFFGFPLYFLVFGKIMVPSWGRVRGLANLLFVASLAAWIPYFYQGKGWPYHQYPAILFGSLAILLPILLDRDSTGPKTVRRRPSPPMIVAGCLAVLAAHIRLYPIEIPTDNFVSEIKQNIRHPTVATMGGDISGAFPLTRMIGGQWIEPYNSDWIIVYVTRMARKARSSGNEAMAQRYLDMLDRYAREKLARFEKHPPELILLDHGEHSGKEAEFLMKHAGYESFLQNYHKIADSHRMAAYLLVGKANGNK